MRLLKFMMIGFAGLALLYGALCAALYSAMRQTPERFGAIMTKVPDIAFLLFPFETFWMSARSGHLKVGDLAPDFELSTVDRSHLVKLSSEYQSKPVVLIFGSYT
jgi:hypothetical protein